jgi:hypothetical protein
LIFLVTRARIVFMSLSKVPSHFHWERTMHQVWYHSSKTAQQPRWGAASWPTGK